MKSYIPENIRNIENKPRDTKTIK